MEKIKLSELLASYEAKYSRKDEKYGYYFEEEHLERKVTKLRLFYKVLGDISLKEDYFKAILYYGQTEQKEEEIRWIGKILSRYENIPDEYLPRMMMCYEKGLFDKYPVSETFEQCSSQYGMTPETFDKFFHYLQLKKFESFVSTSENAKELMDLAEGYSITFAEKIKTVIEKQNIEVSRVFELLPSKEFIDKSKVHVPIGYDILSAEDLVIKTLLGYVDINECSDYERIRLGRCTDGSMVYTSFTKKEYLDELQKEKEVKITKSK